MTSPPTSPGPLDLDALPWDCSTGHPHCDRGTVTMPDGRSFACPGGGESLSAQRARWSAEREKERADLASVPALLAELRAARETIERLEGDAVTDARARNDWRVATGEESPFAALTSRQATIAREAALVSALDEAADANARQDRYRPEAVARWRAIAHPTNPAPSAGALETE